MPKYITKEQAINALEEMRRKIDQKAEESKSNDKRLALSMDGGADNG